MNILLFSEGILILTLDYYIDSSQLCWVLSLERLTNFQHLFHQSSVIDSLPLPYNRLAGELVDMVVTVVVAVVGRCVVVSSGVVF
jgi:hypothetical protein